jgi:hypothetical protein
MPDAFVGAAGDGHGEGEDDEHLVKRRRRGSGAPTLASDGDPLADPRDRRASEVGSGTTEVAADAEARSPAHRVLGKRKLEPRRLGEAEGGVQLEKEEAYVCLEEINASGSTAAEGAALEAPASEEGGSGDSRRRGQAVPETTASCGRAPPRDTAAGASPSSQNSVQSSGAGGERQGDITLDGARGSAHAAVRRRIRGKSSRIQVTEVRGAREPREGRTGDCQRRSPSTARDTGNGLRPGGGEGLLVPARADGEKNTLKSTYLRDVRGADGRAAVVESTMTATGRPLS